MQTNPTPRYTTNIHEAGRVSPKRVKLTADGEGNLLWAELYDCAGKLLGCGPSLIGLPATLFDAATDRLEHAPASSPMYWKEA